MLLRLVAQILSYLFHPLLILTYMLVLLIWANPYQFGGLDLSRQGPLFLNVLINTFLLPVFSILLMRALNMVSDIRLPNREERTAPYIVVGVFYLWLAVTAYQSALYPPVFKSFVLGATIGLFMAFFLNLLFTKVSMHTVGMGGFVAMVLITMLYHSYENMEVLFICSILAAGMVGSSRLLLNAHHSNEIYGGYIIGIIAQLIALRFVF